MANLIDRCNTREKYIAIEDFEGAGSSVYEGEILYKNKNSLFNKANKWICDIGSPNQIEYTNKYT